MKRILFFLIIYTFSNIQPSEGQNLSSEDFGFKIGVNYFFGTHFHRLGFTFQGYYYKDFVQINSGVNANYNFLNLGPKGGFWEFVPNIATHFYWGGENFDRLYNPEILPETNQSFKPYSLGYGVKYYLDSRETSQATGFFALGIDRFLFATENDVFITLGEDKYRTGSFILIYRDKEVQYSIASQLWTGGTEHTIHKKDDDYPSKWGYLDRSKSSYACYSNGILSFGVRYIHPTNQTLVADVGLDSEWIRHFFQNIIVHDQPLFPDSWKKAENPHYPMLQEDGSNYLFKDDEKVKASRLYLQFGLNQGYYY